MTTSKVCDASCSGRASRGRRSFLATLGVVAAASLLVATLMFLAWPAAARGEGVEPPTSSAPTSRPAADDDVEEVEDVEEVDVKPAVVTPADGSAKKAADPSLIGKLHPMVVHVPIGWLLLLMLVELAALRWPRAGDAGPLLALLTIAAFVPAIVTGLLRAEDMAPGVAQQVVQHRNMMLIASGALLVAAITRWARRARFGGGPRLVYLLLLLLAVAFMAVGGHLGGKLVFGESYLPF